MDRAALFAVLVAALLALYAWQRQDFVVRARPGRFECWGRLSLVQQKAFAQFLLGDLAIKAPVKVMGKWVNGRLHLRFRGPLTPGERQRIRNFLLTHW